MINCVAPKTLNEKDAACYIGLSVSFLRKRRCEGNREGQTPGPAFIKAGRSVRYRLADLDAWLEVNLIDR